MLRVTVHDFGELAIVRCAGRLLRGEATTRLGSAMTFRTDKRVIVLDVADMSSIDAGGVGLLASVCRWTRNNGIQLKLMNPPALVRKVLELARLDFAFEICTCDEMAALFGCGSRKCAGNAGAEQVVG